MRKLHYKRRVIENEERLERREPIGMDGSESGSSTESGPQNNGKRALENGEVGFVEAQPEADELTHE
ncbi:hypothetical protein M1329_01730 [Candidatus Marsarchaeota archaeon]|jgi:hypothetical protein|nr:hypothetical protein [Candidatus Marsarchaeota archaeon]MCL5099982.1 hypothetical protein [Candidatus Marsarchaeota archaeon]